MIVYPKDAEDSKLLSLFPCKESFSGGAYTVSSSILHPRFNSFYSFKGRVNDWDSLLRNEYCKMQNLSAEKGEPPFVNEYFLKMLKEGVCNSEVFRSQILRSDDTLLKALKPHWCHMIENMLEKSTPCKLIFECIESYGPLYLDSLIFRFFMKEDLFDLYENFLLMLLDKVEILNEALIEGGHLFAMSIFSHKPSVNLICRVIDKTKTKDVNHKSYFGRNLWGSLVIHTQRTSASFESIKPIIKALLEKGVNTQRIEGPYSLEAFLKEEIGERALEDWQAYMDEVTDTLSENSNVQDWHLFLRQSYADHALTQNHDVDYHLDESFLRLLKQHAHQSEAFILETLLLDHALLQALRPHALDWMNLMIEKHQISSKIILQWLDHYDSLFVVRLLKTLFSVRIQPSNEEMCHLLLDKLDEMNGDNIGTHYGHLFNYTLDKKCSLDFQRRLIEKVKPQDIEENTRERKEDILTLLKKFCERNSIDIGSTLELMSALTAKLVCSK